MFASFFFWLFSVSASLLKEAEGESEIFVNFLKKQSEQ